MPKIHFQISNKIFVIESLSPNLDQDFVDLHNAYFAGGILNIGQLQQHSMEFFGTSQKHEDHDKYFSNFTVVWQYLLQQGRWFEAERIWNLALSAATHWEKTTGKRIHKGLPYYFLAVTQILKGDIDTGFQSMHQALDEDKITFSSPNPQTPAYWFVTLDYLRIEQFFSQNVQETAVFVEQMLKQYRSGRGGLLQLSNFKAKFLEYTPLQESVFQFVHSLYKIRQVLSIEPSLRRNEFTSLLVGALFFKLCVVMDTLLGEKNPNRTKWKFIDKAAFLSRSSSLQLDRVRLAEANGKFEADLQNTLDQLISSSFQFTDNYKPKPIESDLLIAYGFRNFGAHRIESHTILVDKMPELLQSLMNIMFFAVEKLY